MEKKLNNRKDKKLIDFKVGDRVRVKKDIREAERKTKIYASYISQCCLKKKKQAGGCYWSYKEVMTDEANR